MVTKRDIRRFVTAVAKEFSPEKVILFGSYAGGRPTEDSDVDLLVIMRHSKRNVEQALEIDRKIDRSFPLDLIVRPPQEIHRRLALRDMFVQTIVRDGKILYERSHSRVGREGGR
ncbi:MAG: nucleotidyltransferase domain-containing protein [Kiritimatiellae bacterium]|nr:nucleotidyltransferase domain-containing protein [Kiritimatiellia bacterium]